jgi:hypothetical protein
MAGLSAGAAPYESSIAGALRAVFSQGLGGPPQLLEPIRFAVLCARIPFAKLIDILNGGGTY